MGTDSPADTLSACFAEGYQISAQAGDTMGFEDLLSIKLGGSDVGNLREFLHRWDAIASSIVEPFPEHTLRALFLRQLVAKNAIPQDIAHFNRFDHNHREKTFTFLYNSVRMAVARARDDANYDEHVRQMRDGNACALCAPAGSVEGGGPG